MRKIALFAAAAAALMLASCGPKTFPVRTYPMGEKVTLGHLIYTVFETQWLTQLGSGTDARVPQNRFFLVRISVANSGSQDLTVPNLYVEDDKHNEYPELTNGDGVPQWIGSIRNPHPAEAAAGNLLFDCPPGHYKLHIADEDDDHTAYIDIPLNFTSETPEVPVPGSEKKQ
jgi:hypothetical protein